jgi:hypothetical protein
MSDEHNYHNPYVSFNSDGMSYQGDSHLVIPKRTSMTYHDATHEYMRKYHDYFFTSRQWCGAVPGSILPGSPSIHFAIHLYWKLWHTYKFGIDQVPSTFEVWMGTLEKLYVQTIAAVSEELEALDNIQNEFVGSLEEQPMDSENHFSFTVPLTEACRPLTEELHNLTPVHCWFESEGKTYSKPEEVPVGQVATAHLALVGGNPPKRKRKKRRAGDSRMLAGKQLGQINRWVPFDRHITVTLRYNNVLTTDGSGTLAAKFALRNLLACFNGSGAAVNAADFSALFDQVRIELVIIQCEPAPNGPAKGSIVVAVDQDAQSSSPTPNYANILNYGGYNMYDVGKQFEIRVKVPRLMSSFNNTVDPPTGITAYKGGWVDAATVDAPGYIFLGGVNLGNSVQLESFVLTYITSFRFRR